MIKYGTDPLFPHTIAYSLNCGCEAIQFDRLMSCSEATLVTPRIDTCDCSACFFPKKGFFKISITIWELLGYEFFDILQILCLLV